MEKSLQVFKNNEFGEVRTIEESGSILFCGSDVAKALGYARPNDALNQHCKGDGAVFHRIIDSLGREQQAKFISEGNLYRLIMNSKLPSAEKFEKWVIDEVLPTIRRHGVYATAETAERLMNDPDFMIKTFQTLKDERAARQRLEIQAEIDKPKVLFADSVAASHTTILIGELAKIIKQNGVEMGQNRLFEWMRNNGYLIRRRGTDYNMPTQRSMELGLFDIKETAINHSDGHVSISKTVKCSGKAQIYFVNLFCERREA